jgi:imidazole glycerol-phosphate synthase subunit HisF
MRTRVIPTLLLKNESLVKTTKFNNFNYIGDPCNTIRIFNELEVDELMLLDITASKEGKEPNYSLLKDIASECFMPLSYGGGVRSVEQARQIFNIGFEKICINSVALDDINIVSAISEEFGAQAVVGSIDYKKPFFGKAQVFNSLKNKFTGKDVVDWVKTLTDVGVGEILLTAIEKEGTWNGYDIEMIKQVTSSINIPVIAHGGCGKLSDIRTAVYEGGASAVAMGNIVVYQKKGMGVLVNFPDHNQLKNYIKY